MSSQYKVCSLFWDYDDNCYRLRNQNVFEELLNEGWKILRVDIMPPTELSNNAVTATNVYILEREANDD
jgi:hypothetical protein